ncbi:MAG TPA: DMP19 family protein [Steroidobacteraceae bacterium]|jgi:hypothetical protein
MDMNGILIALSASDATMYGKDNFDTQPVPQKVFSAIWSVEAEVNNGGFSQYFFNQSRATAAFVAEALQIVGAPATADICRRAIAVAFPSGLPSDLQTMRIAASDFPSETERQLNALDQEFYRYPHDLTALLFGYVSEHPEDFGELPGPDDSGA